MCVRQSLNALMEWLEDAGDNFLSEICCGAGVPFRLFLAALNQADDAATLPKDCSSRLPLSNGLLLAASQIHQRCSTSYLGSSARLPWLSALGACGLFQSVNCNDDRLLLLFYFFFSLGFGVFNKISGRQHRCGSYIFFSMAKVY